MHVQRELCRRDRQEEVGERSRRRETAELRQGRSWHVQRRPIHADVHHYEPRDVGYFHFSAALISRFSIGLPFAMMMFAWNDDTAVKYSSMAHMVLGGFSFTIYLGYIVFNFGK